MACGRVKLVLRDLKDNSIVYEIWCKKLLTHYLESMHLHKTTRTDTSTYMTMGMIGFLVIYVTNDLQYIFTFTILVIEMK